MLAIPHVIAHCVSQERSFKVTSAVDQLAVLFEMEGNLVHIDSDEGRRLRAKEILANGTYRNMLHSVFTGHSYTLLDIQS